VNYAGPFIHIIVKRNIAHAILALPRHSAHCRILHGLITCYRRAIRPWYREVACMRWSVCAWVL